MDSAALVSRLQELLPAAQIEPAPSTDVQTTVFASPDTLHGTLKTLRDHAELRFVFLAELTAADYLPREPRFELVYILVSIEHRLRLRLKVRLPAHDPHVPTCCDIWPA